MKTNGHEGSIYRVQALERALDILDCFSFQNKEMSLSDVVLKTGLNKTTAKRLMANLTGRGYLKQDPQTKRYLLGMRLFELGGIVFSSFSLRKAAASPMSRLQSETGATVLVGVMMEEQLVYVDKREGDGMVRISSDIGWRRPLHYGMLGMVLMAYLDSKVSKGILRKYPLEPHSPYSITDEDAFSLRLEQIRKQGYVVEKEEAVEGVLFASDHLGEIVGEAPKGAGPHHGEDLALALEIAIGSHRTTAHLRCESPHGDAAITVLGELPARHQTHPLAETIDLFVGKSGRALFCEADHTKKSARLGEVVGLHAVPEAVGLKNDLIGCIVSEIKTEGLRRRCIVALFHP